MDKPNSSPNGASPVPLGPSGVEALRRVQGQVVRAAHALSKALQGQGIDGADLKETAIDTATGLMQVDAEITAALASVEGNSPSLEVEALDVIEALVDAGPLDAFKPKLAKRVRAVLRRGGR